REAFEGAIRSDSTNETAAAALVDAYASEERWREASPLCELLVNAAIRDRNEGALFTRLRLSTRIAAALGEPDRAMTSALSALEARPDHLDARADLVPVGSQCQGAPENLARAEPWLLRIVEAPAGLQAEVLVRLADIQRERGEVEVAVQTLEDVLRAEPEHPG